jgi:hypothetical protein
MTIIAEQFLDLAYSDEKVAVRLLAPRRQDESTWICRFEISAPIDVALDIQGTSSLQALALSLKSLSATLYSTELYRSGQLGAWGEFNGHLGIPAPGIFADIAPEIF